MPILTFDEWKTKVIHQLMMLSISSSDSKLKSDIDVLINGVQYASSVEDLYNILALLHKFAKYHNIDISKILPSEEELDAWFNPRW